MDTRPGYVREEEASFFTWSFIIWYCDEEIEINDICIFRTELDVTSPDYLWTEFFVETELQFIDMSKLTAKTLPE